MDSQRLHQTPNRPPAISWAIVLGLSAMALLWPLVHFTGLDALLGSARSSVLILVIASVWIGVVGLGRVPHPILTLTLVGLGYGVVLVVLGFVFSALGEQALGGGPNFATPFIALVPLGLYTFFGFVAGLIAAGVQRIRRAVS